MKKRKNKKIIVILKVEILILFLLIGYILLQKYKYSDIFCPNTIINGEDCSLLTIEEAMEMIQCKENQYTLEISFKGDEVQTIKATQIDLRVDNLREKLEEIKEQQRKKIFLAEENYNIQGLLYSNDKLENVLSDMKQLQQEYMDEKTNIEYEFSLDEKCFVIKRQEIYYLDYNEVFEKVVDAIKDGSTKISVEDLYLIPENDSALDEMNSLISAKIVYELPKGEEYVLDSSTTYTWLVRNEEGNYLKDEEIWNQNLNDFVENTLKPLVETSDLPREFKPTGMDDTVLVEGGTYGYQLNKKVEIEQLKKELEEGQQVVRKPNYSQIEFSEENYGLGNSYVEIDLTRQKVWVYVNEVLEIETDCVTGCVNKGYDTPTGIFTLTYKQEDRILRGKKLPNGKYEYESHVDYWMPFNRGIGLHDAQWRSDFGGDIYISNGSHGCINLPLEAAKKLYEIINYEMPIVVYKS